jgi:competence protein ComEA
MQLNNEPLRNWFGFTRRERRSSFILLVIVFMIIAVRYTVPERNMVPEDISDTFSDSLVQVQPVYLADKIQPFRFNPNTASYDTLIKLGFPDKEARTLIKYRNKGGKFRKPSDIKKVYGIEERMSATLIPFIEVGADTSEKTLTDTIRQQKLRIEINSCDSASLVRLPGIGPVLSSRIIKYRHLLGGFASIDQFKEVYGLPEETFDLIRASLYVDTLLIKRTYINSADYKELARIPYIERYEVNSILKYRELKGRIAGINDLIGNKLITAEKAAKVRPYLRFE